MNPVRLSLSRGQLQIDYCAPGADLRHLTLFIGIGDGSPLGAWFAPFAHGREGSKVHLSFPAQQLLAWRIHESGQTAWQRTWMGWTWSDAESLALRAETAADRVRVHLPAQPCRLVAWAKDMSGNDGWGVMLPDLALGALHGPNDKFVDRHYRIDPETESITLDSRRGLARPRVRIYQLLPRLFSNTNETRKLNGTIEENGCGKFAEINDAALREIRAMHFTHVWLTGVLRQATATDYSSIGLPADDPDLLKGIAGSPYAIKDYFDVSPDYAVDPANRLVEFRALLARIHAHGLKAIIDFVPNHVARSYHSTVHPDLTFGRSDDRTQFFHPENNFYWLPPGPDGPPLRLPTVKPDGTILSATCLVLGAGDGLIAEEMDCGRVTGNNVASWTPSPNDWYETAKLNYGYDFTTGQRAHPSADQPSTPIPKTWLKMDAVLAWWQELGVDGFRCDMAHMVPPEFWTWVVARARARNPDAFFCAEAYDNDPMKVGHGNVMVALLDAGFDAVYDDPSYKCLKRVYEAGAWANDLDGAHQAANSDYIFQNSLRYAENHDEVRLAGKGQWGEVGAAVGRAVCPVLFGLSRGPVLVYSGQEVGEPADGAEGFGGDDARTTIFDYWSMPQLAKWVNGHRYDGGRLSPEERALREFYRSLLALLDEPAFRDGAFYGLNPANIHHDGFGRIPGEPASGHWLYAYLRRDSLTGQCFLVVSNLHPNQTLHVSVKIPAKACAFLGISPEASATCIERLSTHLAPASFPCPKFSDGVSIGSIPPLTARVLQLQLAEPLTPAAHPGASTPP